MEGHVELPSGEGQNMFGFWKNRLTDNLIDAVKADDGVLIHLATEEYQHLFDWQRVRKEVRIVQPLFYVRKGNDLKMQAVWAKTCRGAMTRFIIENRIDKPEDLCAFSYEGFSYEPKLGEPDYPCRQGIGGIRNHRTWAKCTRHLSDAVFQEYVHRASPDVWHTAADGLRNQHP